MPSVLLTLSYTGAASMALTNASLSDEAAASADLFGADELFLAEEPMNTEELQEARGGFMGGDGLQLDFGFTMEIVDLSDMVLFGGNDSPLSDTPTDTTSNAPSESSGGNLTGDVIVSTSTSTSDASTISSASDAQSQSNTGNAPNTPLLASNTAANLQNTRNTSTDSTQQSAYEASTSNNATAIDTSPNTSIPQNTIVEFEINGQLGDKVNTEPAVEQQTAGTQNVNPDSLSVGGTQGGNKQGETSIVQTRHNDNIHTIVNNTRDNVTIRWNANVSIRIPNYTVESSVLRLDSISEGLMFNPSLLGALR
ncbi:MAG: hypothetical protein AAF224_01470 [Pseudomonadota bacterium]